MDVTDFLEKACSLGVPMMDAQHREYARLINDIKQVEDGNYTHLTLMDIIEELMSFSQFHFKSEENLMVENEYPNYREHKILHQDLMVKLHESLRDIGRPEFDIHEFYQFVSDWVLKHTLGADTELSKFMKGRRSKV